MCIINVIGNSMKNYYYITLLVKIWQYCKLWIVCTIQLLLHFLSSIQKIISLSKRTFSLGWNRIFYMGYIPISIYLFAWKYAISLWYIINSYCKLITKAITLQLCFEITVYQEFRGEPTFHGSGTWLLISNSLCNQ